MQYYVAAPGPTNIPEEIFQAMQYNTHHRVGEFEEIFDFCANHLPPFFGCPNRPVIMNGSGTSAMETVLINTISPKDKVISLEFGKFGERFGKIAETHQCNVIRITSPYGTYPTPEILKKTLSEHPDTKVVITCHCETSTGALCPIHEYADIIADTKAVFLADCISSVGSVNVRQEQHKIDICISSSNKGFMLPPGVVFISYYGEKIMNAMQNSSIPKFYNNISQEIFYQSRNEARWTPSIQIMCGLRKSLEILTAIGVENNIKKHEEIADYANKRLLSLGLKPVVPNDFTASPSVLAYYYPNSSTLIKKMHYRGIIIADGQGSLTNQIFRIGNLGSMTYDKMVWVLDNLEDCLKT